MGLGLELGSWLGLELGLALGLGLGLGLGVELGLGLRLEVEGADEDGEDLMREGCDAPDVP